MKAHFVGLYYNMVFSYWKWVSRWWQRSVDLYKNRKEAAIYRRRNNTQNNTKHRIHKIENKDAKQGNRHKKNI